MGDKARIMDNILSVRSLCLGNFLVKRMVVYNIAGSINNPRTKPYVAIFHHRIKQGSMII